MRFVMLPALLSMDWQLTSLFLPRLVSDSAVRAPERRIAVQVTSWSYGVQMSHYRRSLI
jgi:hypothetical protein